MGVAAFLMPDGCALGDAVIIWRSRELRRGGDGSCIDRGPRLREAGRSVLASPQTWSSPRFSRVVHGEGICVRSAISTGRSLRLLLTLTVPLAELSMPISHSSASSGAAAPVPRGTRRGDQGRAAWNSSAVSLHASFGEASFERSATQCPASPPLPECSALSSARRRRTNVRPTAHRHGVVRSGRRAPRVVLRRSRRGSRRCADAATVGGTRARSCACDGRATV